MLMRMALLTFLQWQQHESSNNISSASQRAAGAAAGCQPGYRWDSATTIMMRMALLTFLQR
jgi:hypothetical protein